MKKLNKDLELFIRYFTQYQNMLGLNGYRVYFKHEPIDGVFADITTTQSEMVATVRLNSNLQDVDKPFRNIKRSAKHEAIHLLVARLEDRARSRYVTSEDIYETVEELVRKIEQSIE